MIRTQTVTAACLACAIGCASAPSMELSEEDLAAIQHRLDELVVHLSPEDNVAWSQDYTEDGILMFEGRPVIRGREALYDFGENDSPVALSISLSDIEIHGSGDWAWVATNYMVEVEGVDEPVPGKQLLVLERQPGGEWLIKAAHVSANQPPPGS